jgi:hypothetical protein
MKSVRLIGNRALRLSDREKPCVYVRYERAHAFCTEALKDGKIREFTGCRNRWFSARGNGCDSESPTNCWLAFLVLTQYSL